MTIGRDRTDKAARIEWQAWQEVVRVLKVRGIDINLDNDLNKALVRWGDKVAELKLARKEEGL